MPHCVHCILARWRHGIAHCATVSVVSSTETQRRCKRWRLWTFCFWRSCRAPLTQYVSQVGVAEVRVSHDSVSTQTGALLDSLPIFAFAHFLPLLLSQATLIALFSFILVFQVAYALMVVASGHYDVEPGIYPRSRAHINGVVFSRFAVIAFLALFVALMRCDPVGAEEEVRSIEPSRTHVLWLCVSWFF